jgi:long-subunit acyl-CoA synthetase (AMP-forming)
MPELLATALAARDAQAIALDDGARALNFGQLREALRADCDWLAAEAVQRCAIAADNGTPWALADLALHLARTPCIPLPGYFTASQRRHALDDAGVDAVLSDAPDLVVALSPDWQLAGTAPASGLTLLRRSATCVPDVALPDGTTKITYTSGSTATPKGVCLGAGHLETVAATLADATREVAIECHLCVLPLATLLENVGGIYAPLLVGARVVLPGLATLGFSHGALDAGRLIRCIDRSRPNSLILVPELLKALVVSAERGWRVPASLRFVAVGGASVAPELLQRAARVGLPVFEGYGLSECASVVCLNTPSAQRPGSVGRALPHVGVTLDDDGQILVSGPSMLGYLGDELRPGGGAYATGDRGEIDAEGYVHVRGRLRNVFISSFGRNVSPEWVERELVQDTRIAQAMVFGEAQPYAVAVLSPGLAADGPAAIAEAVGSANRRLPDYAQVRRWLLAPEPFSVANGLLTPNGRPRRARILAEYGARLEALYRDEPDFEPTLENA